MADTPEHVLRPGDPVVFIDDKERDYFAFLKEGGRTDIRGHQFDHDELIGGPEGTTVRSSRGKRFYVMRPTLAQYVVRMPRFATVIYPKDLGTILVWADIFPGATVLEAGLGSAGLAIALLRAVGPAGKVISYDIRQEAVNRGQKNIQGFLGDAPNHEVKFADVYAGIDETDLDRIVLDVPEPWQVVPHAWRALRDGGVICCYSPTVLQVQQTALALRRQGFVSVETQETLQRPWHVAERSVRPDLQMVGHTGFLTFARKIRLERDPTVDPVPASDDEAASAPEGAGAEGAPGSDETS